MKKIKIIGLLFSAMITYAQSTTENYVQSTTCLSGDCNKKTQSITYFDGLGRPKQVVHVKATTTGKDLVTPITYDDFGRQDKDILPVPVNSLNSAIHSGITDEAAANAYYGAANAFTEKQIENSPLDRVLQVAQPGDPWKMSSGHTQKFKYETNISSDIYKYVTTTTTQNGITKSSLSLAPGETYTAGTLYKNTVKDEDGNEVVEFRNAKDQILLLRKILDDNTHIDTYYVYNEYDKLAFILPPKAIHKPITEELLNTLCYQYRYDGFARLVEKRLPGRDDWESVVYDAADRTVLTQDVNLKNKGQWLFTKYDAYGRTAYTGLIAGADRASMQSQLGTQVISETQTATGFNKNGIMVYYTNNFLTDFTTILTVNYYDSYPRDTREFPVPKILDQYVINDDRALNGGVSTLSLPTASYVKNIEDDNWTKTYFYYNTRGEKIAEKSWNHLGGYTKKEFKLDFSGTVDESYTYHKKSDADAEVVIKETFVYDDQKRLLKHYHKVNSQTEELLAENTYNDLGQLVNKKTGNTTGTPLQSIDQTYNIRGWLTKVNDPANLNGKLFAYEIKYHNPVYSTISTGKYNGNIAEIDWQAEDGRPFSRYNYQYDALDRLKSGIYSQPNATVPMNDYYNESLTYDVNGNIQTLKRNRQLEGVGAQQMDDLSYIYSGNRLTTVSDASANYAGYPSTSGNPFTYDSNGNMTSHLDKGMLQIDYNFLNLPNYIKFDKEYVSHDWLNTFFVNTKYLYNANGIKLAKIHTYGSGRTNLETVDKTDYLDGFQYTNNVLSFVPTSEGYYDFIKNLYIYNYTDQVGNIRLAYYKDDSGNVKVDRTTHFYPFGLEFGGDLSTENSITPNYKYSTHGKEKQQETGWSDFGGRMYMPDTGRWLSPDPLSEEFEDWSPYSYVFNNPVRYVDPDGNAPIDVIGEGDGCCQQMRGFALTMVDNVIGSNLRNKYGSKTQEYINGVNSGHGASMVLAALMATDGITSIGGGTGGLAVSAAASSTGVGAIAGGPGSAVSSGLILKGTLEVAGAAVITSNVRDNMKSDKKSSSSDKKTYQTYTKTHSTNGTVYSGRTSGKKSPEKNVEGRDAKHHMNDKGYGKAVLDKSSKNKNAIRGREQLLIEKNGGAQSQGGTSGNSINGIGQNNGKKSMYIKASKKEFGN